MHCRLCVLGGRKGRFSPLTSALRHYRRNACRSPRLPTPGRCRSVPNATSRIQLQLCDVKSPCASPSYLTDAHAAPNLGQIEKIDDTFDAVGVMSRWLTWKAVRWLQQAMTGLALLVIPCSVSFAENWVLVANRTENDGSRSQLYVDTDSVRREDGFIRLRTQTRHSALQTVNGWTGVCPRCQPTGSIIFKI